MPPKTDEIILRLRITLIDPMEPSDNEELGLQDKAQIVHEVEPNQRGDRVHDFEVRAVYDAKKDHVNFLGKWAHGTPKKRFVYISLLRYPEDGGEPHWVRRMKLDMSTIAYAHIRKALDVDGILEWRVHGKGDDGRLLSATYHTQGGDDERWVVRQADDFNPLQPT